MMNIGNIIIVIASYSWLVHHIYAIEYSVTSTVPDSPGGKVFNDYIGVEYCLQIMPNITELIFTVFEERRDDVANIPDHVYYPREQSKWLFYSVMVHEMAHVFQRDGNLEAPSGLLEGTADYARVKSGYYDPATWTKQGEGDNWDQGYGITERFLEYCDTLLPSFTAKLNKMMRYKYDDAYWVQLVGKPVDQLWKDYKAKYNA